MRGMQWSSLLQLAWPLPLRQEVEGMRVQGQNMLGFAIETVQLDEAVKGIYRATTLLFTGTL